MVLDAGLDLLACPHCHGPLSRTDRTVACSRGHHFDVARQGYLNLLTGAQPAHADTAAMVAARADFLSTGVFGALDAALVAAARETEEVIMDCGGGTGDHAAALLSAQPRRRGLTLDISVPASRRAARAHARLAAVVADTWAHLPVRDEVVDLLLCVFAPRHAEEFARVLRPEGRVIIVTPRPTHLQELRGPLRLIMVDPAKDERLERSFAGHLHATDTRDLSSRTPWSRATAERAVAMGPNAFHQSPEQLDPLLDAIRWPLVVTTAVRMSVWSRSAGR